MKRIVAGILAHVDAGKTTLAESMLFTAGNIRKYGRVDHRDTFLDTNEMERERGITIFSKQAILSYKDIEITLLDTPGHADLSTEMERSLKVIDYAILVISGSDGIQGHTDTLWKLLKRYNIPTFIFINKMDMAGTDKIQLMDETRHDFGDGCIDFTEPDADIINENIAMTDEAVFEQYADGQGIDNETTRQLIKTRKVFPCYFGSALKLEGIDVFMEGIDEYMSKAIYPDEFAARVYKISRDIQGIRVTHLKLTGGTLRVRTSLKTGDKEEKVNQIRLYSGDRFESVDCVEAGRICAVTGLENTFAGQGLGVEDDSVMSVINPVLSYRIEFDESVNIHQAYLKLQQLEEEEPQLQIVWNEELQEIHAQLMGEVQIEVLKRLIKDKLGMDATINSGTILYKETIENTVEGVGHFEPLRHYAEVHLLMEPGETGSGIQITADCSEEILDRNWQRLIMTHLGERSHLGVLTGSPITDIKITLISGRAHLKHTEGGDFRQATYRAVRQGLKQANSILLEPYYEIKLDIPSENAGRAMTDIQKMCGTFEPPVINMNRAAIIGIVPVSTMQGYTAKVSSYTGGRGKLFSRFKGYYRCHNEEEVIEAFAYDSEKDSENPTGSVFCSHGCGTIVPWDKIYEYMHVNCREVDKGEVEEITRTTTGYASHYDYSDKELMQIFEQTYGPVKDRKNPIEKIRKNIPEEKVTSYNPRLQKKVDEYFLVDGYNIIFSWDELNELSKNNLEAARQRLIEILCNYQGYKKINVIVVFDAYKVKDNPGEVMQYNNISVVYTKEAETADMYIEKTVHEIGRKYNVTVATSDGLEQLIIMGQGGRRMSAREFVEEMNRISRNIEEEYTGVNHRLGAGIDMKKI